MIFVDAICAVLSAFVFGIALCAVLTLTGVDGAEWRMRHSDPPEPLIGARDHGRRGGGHSPSRGRT